MSQKSTHESTPQDPRDRARDELLAKQAFEHYCTRIGTNPSPNALIIYYQRYARENPDDTDWIPSRSRNKIYRWHKQYDWDLRYQQRMTRQIERDRKRYEQLRAQAEDNLSLLAEDAVLELKLLLGSGDEKIKLQAVKEVLDRIGLISHDKLPKKDRKDPNARPKDLPKPGASVEEQVRWLLEEGKESHA